MVARFGSIAGGRGDGQTDAAHLRPHGIDLDANHLVENTEGLVDQLAALGSYGQCWCTGSGGGLLLGSLHGLAVAEADALDHLGEPLRAVQPAPVRSADLASLKTIASAVWRDRQPLVLSVRSRTVANVLSIGLLVRTCFQCSAGKS